MRVQNLIQIFLPTVFVAIVIMILSVAQIGDILDDEKGFGDKLGHFTAYFVLTIVFTIASLKANLLEEPYVYWICALIAGFYGAMLEGIQYLLPHRFANLYDLITNFIAAISGAYFTRIYLGKIRLPQ